MNRRIYGLETEFGIIWTPDVPRRKTLTVQNVVMYLFREIVAGRMYPDVFLENGARFYQDIGCHPEYATPECDDVAELVAHDKAGERILPGSRRQQKNGCTMMDSTEKSLFLRTIWIHPEIPTVATKTI